MKFEIPVKLPSLNDYTSACRTSKFTGAKMKAKYEQMIGLYLMKMPRWTKPIKIHFLWVEGSKKRDRDNIAFAKKFILDAMVKCRKLKDDNRHYVVGFTDEFAYGNKTKVILEIEEAEDEIYG
jgi:Holliday junction resolvase RusA-like endonuclease